MKYKKGDIVRVWSLQSFFDGGFINGRKGIVSQDQTGASVLVAVKRKFDGKMKIDPSYEVYEKQLKLVHRPTIDKTVEDFAQWIDNLKRA